MFTPVYHELVPRLKQYMEEQKSGKLPGVRSLAKQFGVNPATVSKAMKILEEKGLISILKGQGAFICRKIQTEKHHSIGIVNLIPNNYTEEEELERLRKPFNYSPHTQEQIRQLVDRECAAEGFHAISLTCNIAAVRDNLAFFEKMPTDGFLFIYSSLNSEIADFLKKKHIPFVAANACFGIPEVNFVDVNTMQAVNDFLLRLREAGVRKVTFFGRPGKYGYSERLRRIFMKHLGSEFRDFYFIDGAHSPLFFNTECLEEYSEQAFNLMMQDGIAPEVILCIPECIESMKQAVRKHGLRTPEDVAFATISIDPDIHDITVLKGDESEILRRAVRRLLHIILHDDDSVIQQWIPMDIVWAALPNSKELVVQ